MADGPQNILLSDFELPSRCHGISFQEVIDFKKHVQPHSHFFFALSGKITSCKVFFSEQIVEGVQLASELLAQGLGVSVGQAIFDLLQAKLVDGKGKC
jgi:hypothetical protein